MQYGPNNPHPLSTLKTELVWDGKYDEWGNRREVDVAGCAMPLQKIETVDGLMILPGKQLRLCGGRPGRLRSTRGIGNRKRNTVPTSTAMPCEGPRSRALFLFAQSAETAVRSFSYCKTPKAVNRVPAQRLDTPRSWIKKRFVATDRDGGSKGKLRLCRVGKSASERPAANSLYCALSPTMAGTMAVKGPSRAVKSPSRPRPPIVPRLLTLKEGAAYVRCSYWTLRDLCINGTVPVVRIPSGRINTGWPRGKKRQTRVLVSATDPRVRSLRKILIDRFDLDRLIEKWKKRP